MQTMTHVLAACVALAVLLFSLITASPDVHADTVETTALVLKIVDGDTVDIVDDVRGRLRVRLSGIDTPRRRSQISLSAAGGPKQHSSPKTPC
jgi:micrococcal nuclease